MKRLVEVDIVNITDMTKREQQRIQRKRQLEAEGWDLKSEERDCIPAHTGDESLKHYHLKTEIARQAHNKNSTVFSEVSNGRGVADILLLRETTQPLALVIEIETGLNSKKAKEKRETFMGPMIQEVLVWRPSEFSNYLNEMSGEIQEKLSGFL